MASETVVVPDDVAELPRVGLVFETVAGFEDASWIGDGPHESYADRRSSALHGRWSSRVDDLATPYVKPQENGGRANVTRLELGSPEALITLRFDRPMQVVASHTRTTDLETTRHSWELPAHPETIVHVDVAHRGLGTASVGPDTLERFRVGPGTYSWSWSFAVTRREQG